MEKDYNAILKRMPEGEKAGIFAMLRADCMNQALLALDNWNDEHPVKTYAQDFFEKHPHAGWNDDGGSKVPNVCLRHITNETCPRLFVSTTDSLCYYRAPQAHASCWNRPMKEETK